MIIRYAEEKSFIELRQFYDGMCKVLSEKDFLPGRVKNPVSSGEDLCILAGAPSSNRKACFLSQQCDYNIGKPL